MRRVPPWLVSVVAHGVVVVVWIIVRPAHETRPTRERTIEIVDVIAPPPPPVVTPEVVQPAGGGGQAAVTQARRTTPVRVRSRPRPRPEPARIEAPTPAPAAATEPAIVDEAAATTATSTADGAAGGGTGGADGTGHGTGTGPGTASTQQPPGDPPVRAFERAVAAPRSRARPARLIYPRSDHEEREEALFVAILTVDSDGMVVGAKLQHRPTASVAVDRAMSGVFRFRYAPALDDAGRPITSRVTQRFMAD